MKKLLVLVLMCVFCVSVFAQVTETGDKPESNASPAMDALQTAYALAKYGYSNQSASALIGAAEIIAQTETQALANKGTQKGQTKDAVKKNEKPEFTPANLLAAGKRLAAGDATMLAWAAQVEAIIKGSSTRGAVGGPRYQVDKIGANGTFIYQLAFRGNELAEILVCGDGDTDLDLYVYNQAGQLIAWDERYGDDCYVAFIPYRQETFTIMVKNRGRVWNRYQIATN